MKLSDFHYELPKSLIAQYPLPNRSESRLLCLDPKTKSIQHKIFKDILELMNPNDLLVFNNTKVIPARLHGKKSSGGQLEVLVERVLSETKILCMLRASKAPKIEAVLYFKDDVKAFVLERKEQFYLLEFNQPILPVLEHQGEMPLPPYMERKEEILDKERYQTVYAKHEGAVAAPTAGLHFDKDLLDALQAKGVQFAFVTLHVGAGTFLPVRVDNILEHQMHHEYIEVSAETCIAVNRAKQKGGRVIAIGTTSVRCLETAALSGELKPFQGDSNIFIYPGFQFHCVDAMITNFHLPESTLIMLVSAFAGREQILNAYSEAVKYQYRFFSYGDAMFISRRMC